MAAQDKALNTKYFATKLLRTETDSKCRLCQKLNETLYPLISACPALAKEQYVKRHDRLSAQIHFNICKEIGVQVDKNTGTNIYQISSNDSRGKDDYNVESASAN